MGNTFTPGSNRTVENKKKSWVLLRSRSSSVTRINLITAGDVNINPER